MTLSEFATFSTALSGLAVTASLIYLALQTHQNTKHSRALINQGRIERISEVLLAVGNKDFAAAVIAGGGGTPSEEAVRSLQFRVYCAASLYGWQDSFAQHERGLLDEDIYRQMCKAVRDAMSQPAFHAVWQDAVRVPDTRFAGFVDAIIASLPKARASLSGT